LTEGGGQQLQSGQLRCRVGSLALLTIPLQGIQEEGNDANGGHNAGQIDHRDLEDLILWRTLQVAVTAASGGAEVGSTVLQILVADGGVRAAAAAMGAA